MERKWFEKLLVKSIVFTLILFVLFFVLKFCFVFCTGGGVYGDNIGEVKDFSEYTNAFINGLRYDSRNIAVFSIVYFLIGLLFFWTQSRWIFLWLYACIVILLSSFIGISEIVFYEIFDDVFNANLLGLLFDDQKAIFKTGISGQYGISTKIMLWIGLSIIFIWFYTKIFGKITREYGFDPLSSIRSRSTKKEAFIASAILFLLFALLMMFSINSSFSFKGVSLDQVVKPVKNTFLRKASTGAFRNLYLVYRGYTKISNSQFSDYSEQTPLEVVKEYFGLDTEQTHYDLRELLAKKSSNISEIKIDYIFYIVAESLSEWHFDKEFDEIDLTSGLKSLLVDAHGAKIDVFLQNAPSTIKSLDVQLTGLFQTEIPVNSFLGKLEPFVTAPGVIMKDLGYQTNFYYGGSGIWQKLDRYTVTQGFDNMYYNTHIVDYAKLNDYPSPFEGLWGAYDHYLYSFVRDNVLKHKNTPSFNMILTTSNHPPYDVPLKSFKAPLDKIKKFLADGAYKKQNERLLGHIWYQDKMITRFIQEVSEVLPNSLFVITGDHYDREYPKNEVSLKSRNTIPLIIYSPALEIKKHADIGSHIDIMPSIVELIAPKEFVYHSFGLPLVGNSASSHLVKDSTLGYFAVATDRFIYTQDNGVEYFHQAMELPNDNQLAQSLYKRLDQGKALSWWILKNGYEIKNDKTH